MTVTYPQQHGHPRSGADGAATGTGEGRPGGLDQPTGLPHRPASAGRVGPPPGYTPITAPERTPPSPRTGQPADGGSHPSGPAGSAGPGVEDTEQYHRERDEAFAARARMAELRGQVAHRLHSFNANHAAHAWSSRHHHRIGPHAVAMFYAEPTGAGWVLRTAPRLVPDSPDVADAARLLFDLADIAAQVIADGLDPRVEMSERPEPMGPHAVYLGVGLSSLDTPAGLWRDVRERVSSAIHIPGRFYVMLADDSAMLAERRPRHEIGSFFVHATHWLGPLWVQGRDWQPVPDLLARDPDTTAAIWYRLRELHTVLSGTGHAR